MITVLFVIVVLFSLFLLSLSINSNKKGDVEVATIIDKKEEVKKVEPVKTKRYSQREIFIKKIINYFLEVFPDGKYVQNFVVEDQLGRKTKIELLLLSTKGLFLINFYNRKGTVFLSSSDDQWNCFMFNGCGYDDQWTIKNLVIENEEKIDILETMDLKYNFYYEPMVIFGPDVDVINNTDIENIFRMGSFQYYLEHNLKEEEDLFNEKKIDYLYKYLMSKKFNED